MSAGMNLLPTPQSVKTSGQGVSLVGEFVLEIVTGPRPNAKVQLAARIIREHLARKEEGAARRVRVVEHPGRADGWFLLIDVKQDLSETGELELADRKAIATFGQGYVLRTQEGNKVCIFGEPQGVLWGAMTLLQLVEQGPSGLRVPGVAIRDYPHFEFRCAADWMTNAEGNRNSMDRGQGWQGFEEVCKRKIDQCLRYKINGILFDGFGWSLQQRPSEYPQVVRRITRHARERGIYLSFGGYGAGYGMAFQKGPLYEDAQYLGQVFKNQAHYPDGPAYQCTGETRAHAVRKGIDTRVLGTCRSNEELNQRKAEELREFVRAVEPGMLYIHHEDYGSLRQTQAAWHARCEQCRRRWPNDDAAAPDGAAGAVAEGYRRLINAVGEVANPETAYVASRDCQILLVSPVYCLSERSHASWDKTLRFWQNAGRQLPAADNVMVCFRETFALEPGGPSWTEAFNAAMREAGLNLGSIIFFITGGDHWLNDYPFVGGSALNNLFLGARAMFHDNGNAYQEPLQVMNAEYCWNTRSTGYVPRPETYEKTWELWIGLSENDVQPKEIYGEGGILQRACKLLYGDGAGPILEEYFGAFRSLQERVGMPGAIDTHQDAPPERKSYLPMQSNKIYALPVLWRALALDSKTWGAEIDNERMVTEMAKLKIDRLELHHRLKRRWALAGQMLESGEGLLGKAMAAAKSQGVREELQFLLDATRIKIPLARGLAAFHGAIELTLGPTTSLQHVEAIMDLEDAAEHAQEAARLAERHYPAIVDPVGEAGAVRTYIVRLEAAVRERIAKAAERLA
jgi:hypothetical protein